MPESDGPSPEDQFIDEINGSINDHANNWSRPDASNPVPLPPSVPVGHPIPAEVLPSWLSSDNSAGSQVHPNDRNDFNEAVERAMQLNATASNTLDLDASQRNLVAADLGGETVSLGWSPKSFPQHGAELTSHLYHAEKEGEIEKDVELLQPFHNREIAQPIKLDEEGNPDLMWEKPMNKEELFNHRVEKKKERLLAEAFVEVDRIAEGVVPLERVGIGGSPNEIFARDIAAFPDEVVQRVLREVDARDLVDAMLSLDDREKNKIYANLSDRSAQMLKEDLLAKHDVTLEQVVQSQERIVATINHLKEGFALDLPSFADISDKLLVSWKPEHLGHFDPLNRDLKQEDREEIKKYFLKNGLLHAMRNRPIIMELNGNFVALPDSNERLREWGEYFYTHQDLARSLLSDEEAQELPGLFEHIESVNPAIRSQRIEPSSVPVQAEALVQPEESRLEHIEDSVSVEGNAPLVIEPREEDIHPTDAPPIVSADGEPISPERKKKTPWDRVQADIDKVKDGMKDQVRDAKEIVRDHGVQELGRRGLSGLRRGVREHAGLVFGQLRGDGRPVEQVRPEDALEAPKTFTPKDRLKIDAERVKEKGKEVIGRIGSERPVFGKAPEEIMAEIFSGAKSWTDEQSRVVVAGFTKQMARTMVGGFVGLGAEAYGQGVVIKRDFDGNRMLGEQTTLGEVKEWLLREVQVSRLMQAFGTGLVGGALGESLVVVWKKQLEDFNKHKGLKGGMGGAI